MSALRRYMFVAERFVATCIVVCMHDFDSEAMTRVFVKLRVAWRDGREEDRVSIWFHTLDEAHRCARNFECWASTRADIRKFAATIKEIQLNFASIY